MIEKGGFDSSTPVTAYRRRSACQNEWKRVAVSLFDELGSERTLSNTTEGQKEKEYAPNVMEVSCDMSIQDHSAVD